MTTLTASAAHIVVRDDVLSLSDQQDLLAFLKGPGWAYGAYSESGPNPSRYWYKHFAGVNRDHGEAVDGAAFDRALQQSAPLVHKMWAALRAGPLAGHSLTRCYANGYPVGAEGGLHLDSKVDTHFTSIYYPHLAWSPNHAGETVFFNADGSDIIASIYPRPNRLVIFPGTIPHVARAVSRTCPELRITLMFKTAVD